ncbi:MAG: AI-2E family transporter [Candidatus Eremiobacteraeota bacterium]|nr:AI-2E family transporter [Candidatus Eremiobacteraeota bacterium]
MAQKPKIYTWFTEERMTYVLKLLAVFVLALYVSSLVLEFLARIGSISIIIIAAIFFAYLLYPAVRLLNGKLPLLTSVLVVYALLALLIGLLVAIVVPALSSDITQIAQYYPQTLHRSQIALYDSNTPLIGKLPLWMRNYIAHLPAQLTEFVRTHGVATATRAMSLLIGTFTALAALVIVPVLAAYLLLDSENLKRYFVALIPEMRREKSLNVLSQLEEVIGGFIRGQFLVGASVGILITIMLLLMHVRYAVLIGVMAGVLDVIPYIDAAATFIPAVSLAFVDHGSGLALVVAVLFIAIFELEGHVIAPNIVSKTVALSPLAVILAILIGGELMGIFGMFVAVPIAGMLRVIAMHVVPPKASVAEAQPALTEAAREEAEPIGEPLA